jgi:uncharacterized protein YeaO (DUF488 family)
MITIRRLYNPEKPEEHYKVLVDRLWPRGISKEKAFWDEWMKEISPSNELRKWFNHDPVRWDEFKQLYKKELAPKQAELKKLRQLELKYGTLTLLYSSREEVFNNAVALREFLLEQDN